MAEQGWTAWNGGARSGKFFSNFPFNSLDFLRYLKL